MALLCALSAFSVSAQESHHVDLDLLVFTQLDDGGDLNREEAFGYYAFRADLGVAVSDRVTLRANSAFALINSADQPELAESIENAETTSASGRLVALTTSWTFEWRPDDWTLALSGYYHQQKAHFIPGGSIHVGRSLAGGDAHISFDYALREGLNKRKSWDDTLRTREFHSTHNLLLTFSQTFSPAWLGSISLQLTRHVGFQSNPLNFVVIYEGGTPVRLTDELLPRRRDRAQLNLRARWSGRPGLSVGFDSSGYVDDWGIVSVAGEPSLELPLGDTRWRSWYRLSGQTATDHFAVRPQAEAEFQTMDSDLGAFVMHSLGTRVLIPWGRGAHDVLTAVSLSAYGFARDDGIYGMGMGAGVGWNWP